MQLFNSYDSQIGDSIREYYFLKQRVFFHKSAWMHKEYIHTAHDMVIIVLPCVDISS